MEFQSAWQAYTGSTVKWLRGLAKNGTIAENDTVWQGPDGSYGVGDPTLGQMDDEAIMEMVDVGNVSEWIDEEEDI